MVPSTVVGNNHTDRYNQEFLEGEYGILVITHDNIKECWYSKSRWRFCRSLLRLPVTNENNVLNISDSEFLLLLY